MNELNILGAILAGGKSKRMGKIKLFLELNDKPLIEYTIDKVKKYFEKTIIITNHENEFFTKNNLITVKDHIEGQLGPLVGILTAMQWAKKNFPQCAWWQLFLVIHLFFPKALLKNLLKNQKKTNPYCYVLVHTEENIIFLVCGL